MKSFFFCLFAFVLASCSCDSQKHEGMRIGIDSNWYPLNFGKLQPYVNGYVEELLVDISSKGKIELEKIEANWDTLMEGLSQGKYDGILCSLSPHNFNQAKYDFSADFLPLGAALIVSSDSKLEELKELEGKLVGCVNGEYANLLQKVAHPIQRNYKTAGELLDALAGGEISVALMDRLQAVNYVQNFHPKGLKVVSTVLEGKGLHLVTLKGKAPQLMRLFNKKLAELKKKKRLEAHQQKWNLAPH